MPIEHRWVDAKDGMKCQISILRLDSIHPVSGGNKTFKLYENVTHFFDGNFDGIASVGGQFSNHIAALAQIGKDFAIPTVAFIRGEKAAVPTITVRRAMENGMQIVYVSRERYREIRIKGNPMIDFSEYKNYFFIPEGGSNDLGVDGSKNIVNFIPADYTHVLCAVGTGATLKGIASILLDHQKIIGVKVVEAKQEEFIYKNIDAITHDKIILNAEYLFGGYARQHKVLDDFVMKWNEKDSIKIEPIYTGRLFFAAQQLIKQNFFQASSNILLIHSGGLQYVVH
ncbi:MAG: pyridoxal-phosphate dependent enzyme [Bacteroidetes bacterium]|nr:pyridoxal-phosphate dependent enzyme [Bacteroidota bacterium]